MKKLSSDFAWTGLLIGVWLPFACANKYIFDKETDALLLDLAVVFVVLCSIFFILMVILSVFFYTRYNKRSRYSEYKGYTVTFRDGEPLKGDSISSPFYGHGIYSYRSENSIYLPGRVSYIGNKTDEGHAYENNGVVLSESEKKRDSPPPEKGQEHTKRSEKTRKDNATFENPAFEIPGYEILGSYDDEELDSHDYEMLDENAAVKGTTREI